MDNLVGKLSWLEIWIENLIVSTVDMGGYRFVFPCTMRCRHKRSITMDFIQTRVLASLFNGHYVARVCR